MPSSNGTNTRLDSWKDIASYLRRDVRTVIRWEKQKGLPVRRVPGGQRKSVFAYTAELDSWLSQDGQSSKAASGVPEPVGATETMLSGQVIEGPALFFSRLPRRFVAIGLVAAVACAVLLISLRLRSYSSILNAPISNAPVRVAFTSTSLQAFGEQGQLLWNYRFDASVDDQWQDGGHQIADLVRVADFRGDGEQEVLATVPLHTDVNWPSYDHWQMDMFSNQGKLLWSYIPQWRFQFGRYELGAPWAMRNVLVTENEGKKRIWMTGEHGVWGNGFVVNLDPFSGKDTLRFVNTGCIHMLAEMKTTRAKYLLVAGFNNEHDTGSLAVIDESKPFAASPQSVGSRHECVSCPNGKPDFYFVFPRSEINEFFHIHEDAVIGIEVNQNRIEVRKFEMAVEKPGDAQTIYSLEVEDDEVRVTGLRYGSGYDMIHRSLEKEGKIDHTLENCPERLHPHPVKVWTPENGWREIAIPAATFNQ